MWWSLRGVGQVHSDQQYAQIMTRFKKSLDAHIRTRLELKAATQTLSMPGTARNDVLKAINVRRRGRVGRATVAVLDVVRLCQ